MSTTEKNPFEEELLIFWEEQIQLRLILQTILVEGDESTKEIEL